MLAPIMFGVAIAYLICLATLVVAWVDIPNLHDKILDADLIESQESLAVSTPLTAGATALIFILWPLFWAEAVFHWVTRPWTGIYRSHHLRSIAFCLFPPLRMCARNPDLEGAMWFPGLGWRVRSDQLRSQLQRFFSLPMLGIAILILPVLAIEFFLSKQVAEHAALRYGLLFSTGLIWFAFTCEFIVMISAAEDRLAYCKKHWLDIAIILLPLLSFLRSLQIVRATRLAKMTKVQQLTKMVRVYRLRGVSTRALRALLLLEVANKLIRPKPAKLLVKLRADHRRLTRELRELEALIAKVSLEVEAENSKRGSQKKTYPEGGAK